MTSREVRKALYAHAESEKGQFLQKFFKTGPGEYSEGDVFIGVTVPQIRAVAKKYRELPLQEIALLLHAKVHEERLLALIILVLQFERGDEAIRKKVFQFYIKNIRHVNNWDLVDSSAPGIVGAYLEEKDKSLLDRLARSKSL